MRGEEEVGNGEEEREEEEGGGGRTGRRGRGREKSLHISQSVSAKGMAYTN